MIWILGLLSGYLFFVPGRGKEETFWYDFIAPLWLRNKIYRKVGCSLLLLFAIWTQLGFSLTCWWKYLIIFGLSFGFVSTYHDYLGELKTLPSGEKYREENTLSWTVTGFFYGLAITPLYWCGIPWQTILLRSIVLAIAIPIIRKIFHVHLQEFLSGFVYILTILLCLQEYVLFLLV